MILDFNKIPTPTYLCLEEKLEQNLQLIDHVQKETNVKIIMALKGYAIWKTFPMIAKFLPGIAASGLYEAKLGREEMNKEVHTYSTAFKEEDMDEIIQLSDYIIFNSLTQWQRYKSQIQSSHKDIKCGLRINPEYSEVNVDLYNPCQKYSRMGTPISQIKPELLDGISGFHFHALCEQDADVLGRVLEAVESKFGSYFSKIQWINFGGGLLITKKGFQVDLLIQILKKFKQKYPHLEIYLEPSEAIGWQTGYLVSSVIDIIHNEMDIAILDTSAENHMPDCLAMPYRPDILGAGLPDQYPYTYRLGGNTCLSGDILGDYSFLKPLQIGDKVVFDDMIHYTIVKSTTFNGMPLPAITLWTKDQKLSILKEFDYSDYKNRLS